MSRRDCGKPSDPLVYFGVVFHCARSERIDVFVDVVIHHRQACKMPYGGAFTDLWQPEWCRSKELGRYQFVYRTDRNLWLGEASTGSSGPRFVKNERHSHTALWPCVFGWLRCRFVALEGNELGHELVKTNVGINPVRQPLTRRWTLGALRTATCESIFLCCAGDFKLRAGLYNVS